MGMGLSQMQIVILIAFVLYMLVGWRTWQVMMLTDEESCPLADVERKGTWDSAFIVVKLVFLLTWPVVLGWGWIAARWEERHSVVARRR
jgi:hypothetical protein